MNSEEKELLLIDLSARLPYGVVYHRNDGANIKLNSIDVERGLLNYTDDIEERECKPYLRPMSSMTEEEHNDFYYYHYNIGLEEIKKSGNYLKAAYLSDNAKYDWLNKYHFDYRYLIEKGLAIAVTKENNPYKS